MTSGSRRAVFVALLVAAAAGARCGAQNGDVRDARANENDALFLATARAEEKNGAYLFYTQSFKDQDNERAEYRGSVYGVVRDVKLDGCTVTAEILIADSFSGTVGKSKIEHQQDTYTYRASFVLTRELADALTMVRARPAQLAHNTHFHCEGDGSCAFDWLRLQTKRRTIKEVCTINSMVDFDGFVDHLLMPLSSADAGTQWIALLRALVDSRCQ